MKKCQGCQEPGDRTKGLSSESIPGCVGTGQLCGCNLCSGGYRSGSEPWRRRTGQEQERVQGHVLKGHAKIRKAGVIDGLNRRHLFQMGGNRAELGFGFLSRPQGNQLGTQIAAVWNRDS